MQYSFRLAEILGHVPDPRKRPGTIKSIVEYTGLDRHQVAALLKNEVKYIPLKALSRLCDYLIEYGHASADQLPGCLFAVEPENFWELLARRSRLEMCLGVRKDQSEENPDVSFVVASDSVLLGELLNGVTTLGGTAKHKKSDTGVNLGADPALPHPEHLKQTLVWSPGQATESEVKSRAQQVYKEFAESKGDKAIVGIGSTKSNPVVEVILAKAFDCEPFESQDNVETSAERRVPFFLRYREQDPKPPSCVAGLQLSKQEQDLEPGIYFEVEPGKWENFASKDKKEDCGFVFYIHRESLGRLEMVLGGFSGRATRLLARSIAMRGEDFWPPVYSAQGIQVGAFIVQFSLPSSKKNNVDILQTDLIAQTKVTALPEEVLKRRFER